jgi:hypothetical protein
LGEIVFERLAATVDADGGRLGGRVAHESLGRRRELLGGGHVQRAVGVAQDVVPELCGYTGGEHQRLTMSESPLPESWPPAHER